MSIKMKDGDMIDLLSFLKSEDIGLIENLPEAIITFTTGSPAEKALQIAKTIHDIAHLPTFVFWKKMERYLRGTFHNYEEQVKMASRFEPGSKDYKEFCETMFHMVNQIECGEKLDDFARLTRALSLFNLELALFYKLNKYLLLCTCQELDFIRACPYYYRSRISVMISSLYQYGLFSQTADKVTNETFYELSDFAKALKRNCLNFDDSLGEFEEQERIRSLNEMQPISIAEQMSFGELDQVLKGSISSNYDEDSECLEMRIGYKP